MSYNSSEEVSKIPDCDLRLGLDQLSPTGKLCTGHSSSQDFAILVADDNIDVVRELARVLKAQGYFVHQAIGGDQAVIIAKARQPDAVIMDFSMRDQNGFRVRRRLRTLCSDVELIVTTNHLDSEQEAKAEGLTVLRKPIDLQELLTTLAGCVTTHFA